MKAKTVTLGKWRLKIHEPETNGVHPVVLMLHGWTGTEESMWVFAPRLPANATIIAPRGFYPTPLGGYSWHLQKSRAWPWIEDFWPAIQELCELLDKINFPCADFSNFNIVGFSQGAALMYSLALMFPQRVRVLAGLSGFMPDGVNSLVKERPLTGKPVFVAHGTRDELVPVERARLSVELLNQAGAEVTYCENDVGHKLSLPCFRSLEQFFADNKIHQA